MNRYLLLLLVLIGVSAISFGIHYAVLKMNHHDHWWIGSGYSLEGMYTFGAIASVVMVLILLIIDYAMPVQVGFAFLVGMTLKAVGSYVYIHEGINLLENDFIELNFLVVFFVYLLFDAFAAYYIVNQQETANKN
ncbi:hypothetical protein CHU00_02380 [Sphingobacterium cellulitidis]|uniref:hypothetical protein n=1 Tax=Sphingobacterium cellulitidis TaxID=1768011 RepID=UPI000B94453D|nr:hypothetical protein [Sphingobacterium cellulitidis]OYD43678.1 hypothetical protein CHT99_01515 [Sphingobacterium cellulitidis]OYD46935.1 hypothetical protein CHU00_02380 [Sphingobacterium cellulitidis]